MGEYLYKEVFREIILFVGIVFIEFIGLESFIVYCIELIGFIVKGDGFCEVFFVGK